MKILLILLSFIILIILNMYFETKMKQKLNLAIQWFSIRDRVFKFISLTVIVNLLFGILIGILLSNIFIR
jgi:MFS superfamily sulfate permease-like transporter